MSPIEKTATPADIARRFPENPILTPADITGSAAGLTVECLLNPAAFRFDGKIWLLLRVAERPKQKEGYTSFPILGEDGIPVILEFNNSDPLLDLSDPRVLQHNNIAYLTTLSHLRLVASDDGIHFAEKSYQPIMGRGELEAYGIEDCRVTQMGESYFMTYTAVSSCGVGVGMRSTVDWRSFKDHGMIIPPHNKDCALFEEKIGGKYYAFHRPSSVAIGGNYIWMMESPDLHHWGKHRCVAKTRAGMWDCGRVGAGASPIRTSKGWLAIYHGADLKHRYCLGALLLDLEEPWRVLARSDTPIMEPQAPYEQTGFFGNVVFTNGHVVDGDRITMYYGASDSVICGAHFSIQEILATLLA
ncbi:MAG TPA: glycoside hydrolase family 130 protein [Terriglobales bacterium]|nr:glycoside hydrolase family 130 protein [Terriglobales bacterium]